MNKILKHAFSIISITVLVSAALASVLQGFSNALMHSQDFQIWGAEQFISGTNPYIQALEDPKSVYKSQFPNYLYPLYLILTPLTLIDNSILIFALINIFLSIYSCFLLSKHFNFSFIKGLAVLCIFLCSTPLRNTIGNGQISIVVFTCLVFHYYNKQNFLATAIGFSKYSFAPLFACHQFLTQQISFFKTILIIFASAFLIAFFTNTDILQTIFGPFKVSKNYTSLGTADIFSITHYFFGSQNNGFQLSSYLMGFGLGCYFIWKMNSILKSDALIPFLFTASLTFLPHLAYDYVFLLPLLFFSLNYKLNKFKRFFFFMTIFYFWFFLKIIAPFSIPYIFTAIPGFLLMLFSCELLTSCSKETLLK